MIYTPPSLFTPKNINGNKEKELGKRRPEYGAKVSYLLTFNSCGPNIFPLFVYFDLLFVKPITQTNSSVSLSTLFASDTNVTKETADQTYFFFFFFFTRIRYFLGGIIYLFIEFQDKGRKLLLGFFWLTSFEIYIYYLKKSLFYIS